MIHARYNPFWDQYKIKIINPIGTAENFVIDGSAVENGDLYPFLAELTQQVINAWKLEDEVVELDLP